MSQKPVLSGQWKRNIAALHWVKNKNEGPDKKRKHKHTHNTKREGNCASSETGSDFQENCPGDGGRGAGGTTASIPGSSLLFHPRACAESILISIFR